MLAGTACHSGDVSGVLSLCSLEPRCCPPCPPRHRCDNFISLNGFQTELSVSRPPAALMLFALLCLSLLENRKTVRSVAEQEPGAAPHVAVRGSARSAGLALPAKVPPGRVTDTAVTPAAQSQHVVQTNPAAHQTRPDQARPDQTNPAAHQTRPDQATH